MASTIFAILRRDHDTQRDLLARLADTHGDTDERRELFASLQSEMESHAAAEERSLYAAMMRAEGGQEKARHSVHEHKQMADLLEELADLDPASPAWLPKLRALRTCTEHHLDEEEHEVFQLAGRLLADDDQRSLAPLYEETRVAEA